MKGGFIVITPAISLAVKVEVRFKVDRNTVDRSPFKKGRVVSGFGRTFANGQKKAQSLTAWGVATGQVSSEIMYRILGSQVVAAGCRNLIQDPITCGVCNINFLVWATLSVCHFWRVRKLLPFG